MQTQQALLLKESARAPAPKPLESAPLSNVVVLKLSGKLLADPRRLSALAEEIKDAVGKGSKIIIVHGGGKQIDEALSAAGIATEKRDGIRMTSPEAMEVIIRVLEGINHDIAAALRSAGMTVRQAGIGSGAPIVLGKAVEGTLTGNVSLVKPSVLKYELGRGDVIVMTSLGIEGSGDDFRFLNINADEVAASVAAEIGAKKLIMLSDKPVLGRDGSQLHWLDQETASRLMAEGVITDGMAVKSQSLLAAAAHVADVLVAGEDASLGSLLAGDYSQATRVSLQTQSLP